MFSWRVYAKNIGVFLETKPECASIYRTLTVVLNAFSDFFAGSSSSRYMRLAIAKVGIDDTGTINLSSDSTHCFETLTG